MEVKIYLQKLEHCLNKFTPNSQIDETLIHYIQKFSRPVDLFKHFIQRFEKYRSILEFNIGLYRNFKTII